MNENIFITTTEDTTIVTTQEREIITISDSGNQEITIVEDSITDIEIITIKDRGEAGVKGDTGDTGPPSIAVGFTHYQNTASDTWICNHNLNIWPTVSVLSPGMVEMIGEVVYISTNQVQIRFSMPTTGIARFV